MGNQSGLEYVESVVALGIVGEDRRRNAVQVPQAQDVGIEGEHDADRGIETGAHLGDNLVESRRVERRVIDGFNELRLVILSLRRGATSFPPSEGGSNWLQGGLVDDAKGVVEVRYPISLVSDRVNQLPH